MTINPGRREVFEGVLLFLNRVVCVLSPARAFHAVATRHTAANITLLLILLALSYFHLYRPNAIWYYLFFRDH